MSKVKIVQIAMAGTSEDIDVEYLDNKGRVWSQRVKMVDNPNESSSAQQPRVASYYWVQIDMPDEPEQ